MIEGVDFGRGPPRREMIRIPSIAESRARTAKLYRMMRERDPVSARKLWKMTKQITEDIFNLGTVSGSFLN